MSEDNLAYYCGPEDFGKGFRKDFGMEESKNTIRVKLLNFYVLGSNNEHDSYYDAKKLYKLDEVIGWDEVTRDEALLLKEWVGEYGHQSDNYSNYHYYVLITEDELGLEEPPVNIQYYLDKATENHRLKVERLASYNRLQEKERKAAEKRKKTKLLKQIARLEEMKKEAGIQ